MVNMKLYLISQTVNNEYDTYDSAVVCAVDESDAKKIHPNNDEEVTDELEKYFSSWCKLSEVKCELIGDARDGFARGVVCASYNAG